MGDKINESQMERGEFLISVQRPSQDAIEQTRGRSSTTSTGGARPRTSLTQLFNPPNQSDLSDNLIGTSDDRPSMRLGPSLLEPNYDNDLTMNSIQLQALREMVSHIEVVRDNHELMMGSSAGMEEGEEGDDEFGSHVGDMDYIGDDDGFEDASRSRVASSVVTMHNGSSAADAYEAPAEDDMMRVLPRFTTMDFEGRVAKPEKNKVSHQKHKQRIEKHGVKMPNAKGKGSAQVRPGKSNGKTRPSVRPPSVTFDQNRDLDAPFLADHCVLCERPLPHPIDTQTIQIRKLKPRFVREIRRLHPSRSLHPNARICVKDLHAVLQTRIEVLLEEDQNQLARLLDDAMKSIGEFEQQEPVWQKQFEVGWTFSERAADAVARFGGSWKFIGCLLGFLGTWMGLNLILEKVGSSPWDGFPFILLNLFLSSIAALQAPIIMMSQNRQSQLDRTQNSYVSKIILRAEHQVRHVNAKMDHLLSHQWKRLLEIQEIEIDLLQSLQIQHRKMLSSWQPLSPNTKMKSHELPQPSRASGLTLATPISHSTSWIIETSPDEHTRILLSCSYGAREALGDSRLVFAHWHTDGDNFMGMIDNVRVELRGVGIVKRITYDVNFNDITATLDDIFSGEGTITLRNDFDLKHMVLGGKIANIVVFMKDKSPVSLANGDLPPRYKSAFGNFKRADKITDFWKVPVSRITITYIPPFQGSVLTLRPNQVVRRIRLDFFPTPSKKTACLFMKTITGHLPNVAAKPVKAEPEIVAADLKPAEIVRSASSSSISSMKCLDPLGYLNAIAGPRPFSEEWRKVAVAEWEKEEKGGSTDSYKTSMLLLEAQPITSVFEEELRGPATFIFLCDETRVSFHASIED
ncbi:hypothetical protein HDU67_004318 [Dinochytrium kinnereticum]|nr:hypothetical protein HDU67_004318 [Dinochytrium kinnereticum]